MPRKARLVGRERQRAERLEVLGGPVARTSAVPSAARGATTSSIGMPSAVMPGVARRAARRSPAAPRSARARPRDRPRRRPPRAASARRPSGARRRPQPPSAAAIRRSGRGRAAAGTRGVPAGLLRERRDDLRLALRPDARAPRADGRRARRCRSSPTVEISSAAPISSARSAPTPSSGRRRRARAASSGELGQLRDLAGLDELAQPRLDATPDAAQLAHAALPDERRHRHGSRADQLRRPPVRTRRVRVRLRELQQRRHLVEPPRHQRVVDRQAAVHARVVTEPV